MDLTAIGSSPSLAQPTKAQQVAIFRAADFLSESDASSAIGLFRFRLLHLNIAIHRGIKHIRAAVSFSQMILPFCVL